MILHEFCDKKISPNDNIRLSTDVPYFLSEINEIQKQN